MSQSSITAAALVIAFVIFVTVRGELPVYFGALGIGPQSQSTPASQAGFGLAGNLTALSGATTGQSSGVVFNGAGGGSPVSVNVGVNPSTGQVGGTVGIKLPGITIGIPIGGGGTPGGSGGIGGIGVGGIGGGIGSSI